MKDRMTVLELKKKLAPLADDTEVLVRNESDPEFAHSTCGVKLSTMDVGPKRVMVVILELGEFCWSVRF